MRSGRVRVACAVGEGVVLAVEDGVGARVQVRRSLQEPGEEMEGALGARAHDVHAVGGVAMLEKALHEHAEQPMTGKEEINQAGPPGFAPE